MPPVPARSSVPGRTIASRPGPMRALRTPFTEKNGARNLARSLSLAFGGDMLIIAVGIALALVTMDFMEITRVRKS